MQLFACIESAWHVAIVNPILNDIVESATSASFGEALTHTAAAKYLCRNAQRRGKVAMYM